MRKSIQELLVKSEPEIMIDYLHRKVDGLEVCFKGRIIHIWWYIGCKGFKEVSNYFKFQVYL